MKNLAGGSADEVPHRSVRGWTSMPDATISLASMKVIKLLIGNPPMTISDLVQKMDVTRTAVTEQLNELMANGFVERTRQPVSGRGRPRHMFTTTPAALVLLFASNQRLVVPAIWKAIHEIGGPELSGKVLKRVAQSIVEHYRPRITGRTPKERLRQLTQVLNEEGHVVEVVRGSQGQVILRKRSCPFINMFEETRTICGVDLQLLSAVAEAPVCQTASRHDGAPCCSFEVAPPNGK